MGKFNSCRRTTLISCLGTALGTEKGLLSEDFSLIFYKAVLGQLTLQRNTFTVKHLPLHIYTLLNLPVAFSPQACVEL